jgi:hypothetical protein
MMVLHQYVPTGHLFSVYGSCEQVGKFTFKTHKVSIVKKKKKVIENRKANKGMDEKK